MKILQLLFPIGICVLLAGSKLSAQVAFPSLSPKGQLSQIVGHTRIELEYERPMVRNRKIFGGLVPWDQVWRTGAGYCTKMRFDRPVQVGGQPVPAGTYSLLTIPNPDEWVVILNADTTLYGSYDYNSGKDVARFVVQPQKTDRHYEALTIDIDILPNDATVYVSWANTQISFDLQTGTDEAVMAYIREELLSGKSEDPDQYGLAADYLFYQNTHFQEVLRLADQMIRMGGNEGWGRTVKMMTYEKLHRYQAALQEIFLGMEDTKASAFEQEIHRRQELQTWMAHEQRIRSKL